MIIILISFLVSGYALYVLWFENNPRKVYEVFVAFFLGVIASGLASSAYLVQKSEQEIQD